MESAVSQEPSWLIDPTRRIVSPNCVALLTMNVTLHAVALEVAEDVVRVVVVLKEA